MRSQPSPRGAAGGAPNTGGSTHTLHAALGRSEMPAHARARTRVRGPHPAARSTGPGPRDAGASGGCLWARPVPRWPTVTSAEEQPSPRAPQGGGNAERASLLGCSGAARTSGFRQRLPALSPEDAATVAGALWWWHGPSPLLCVLRGPSLSCAFCTHFYNFSAVALDPAGRRPWSPGNKGQLSSWARLLFPWPGLPTSACRAHGRRGRGGPCQDTGPRRPHATFSKRRDPDFDVKCPEF